MVFSLKNEEIVHTECQMNTDHECGCPLIIASKSSSGVMEPLFGNKSVENKSNPNQILAGNNINITCKKVNAITYEETTNNADCLKHMRKYNHKSININITMISGKFVNPK
uniref:Uncharacterized protein n=1 Tax=Euplotes crassus TaxID=5936 RepID=A0A7S3KEL1_EUPCR|mmetsp:Transcript_20618/g.20348  ORF Transcript_20618/g.20348 Transcript_20618/m.20348 type:complete len:111 (+) Transcript_20618:227-559(+)